MPGYSRIWIPAEGDILTAAAYNAEHNNHINHAYFKDLWDGFDYGSYASRLIAVKSDASGLEPTTKTVAQVEDAVDKAHDSKIWGTKEIDETDLADNVVPHFDATADKWIVKTIDTEDYYKGWKDWCVNRAKVDSNGRADFITAGTGLEAIIDTDGGSTPLECLINGKYCKRSTNLSVSLTASATNFIWVEKPSSGDEISSAGSSTLEPVYDFVAPSSPATDQHWFDLSCMKMKRWDGSAWEEKDRIFIGEAVTDATSVTSVVSYALRGLFVSDVLSVTYNTTYDINSNLGIEHSQLVGIQVWFRENSSYNWAVVVDESYPAKWQGFVWGCFQRNKIRVRTAQNTVVHSQALDDYGAISAGGTKINNVEIKVMAWRLF